MAYYAVYNTETSALYSIGTVLADPLPEWASTIEYVEQPDGLWDAASKTFSPSINRKTNFTRLEFLRRLTSEERIAIRASDNMYVIDFLELLAMAEDISIADPTTIEAVNAFAGLGLIEQTRVEELLS